ncbi:MAG TPA: LacI family DNA-binding transcriptional regulator [Silvibacterium sp.]|jgi:LacI family transcriptional regulator|nr:LacI family DNA-binding transcriptional regulator [Silvibacterium sp.]
MDRKPTMNDVARVAGVGTMTVSRVLNESAPVSAEAAERVYRAIEKLGYRPNEMARALRGLKSHSIGVIVPYLYDPFFATIAHEINALARENGYSVILATSNEDSDLEFAEAQLMLQRRVDGLIVIPADAHRSRLSHAEFDKIHIVTLDRPMQDRRFDTVLVQNLSGSKRAVQHLIDEHGHRRIVYIGLNRQLYTMRARFEGYRRAMVEAALQAEPSFKCGTQKLTSAIISSLMREKNAPTAFFCSNNLTTRYALRALLDLSVRVPEEAALIGFDDFELAEILHPTLTVVRQPVDELGRVAASLLFDRLKRDEFPAEGNKVVLPVELVIRRSCGCRPCVRSASAD